MQAPNPAVRMGGVFGMAAFGGAEAREALLIHAERENDPGVRGLTLFCAAVAMAPRPIAAPAKDGDRSPWAQDH